MKLFLSLVGRQPTGIAVALATLQRLGEIPERIVLIPTAETLLHAQRLKTWCPSGGFPEPEIEPAAARLVADGELPPAVAVVRDAIAGIEGKDIAYLADPGPKTLVAGVAQVLPRDAWHLHCGSRYMYRGRPDATGERWDCKELADLGIEALLTLTDLKCDVEPVAPECLPKALLEKFRGAAKAPDAPVFRRLRFETEPGEPVAELAYEKRGRLYLLFVIEGDTADLRLQRYRQVSRLRSGIGGLRVDIAVWSSVRTIYDHARADGITPAGDTQELRANTAHWLQRDPDSPGEQTLDPNSDIADVVSDTVLNWPAEQKPATLVVALGADPSATLVSIATHRPARVAVVYDKFTPIVVQRRQLLERYWHLLGVESIAFVPTNWLGSRLVTWAKDNATTLTGTRADITPGTKAQACAMGRMPGAELWCLDGAAGVGYPLQDPAATTVLQGPPLAAWAAICGGDLLEEPRTIDVSRLDFFCLLLEFLACHVATRNTRSLADIRNLKCFHGHLKVTARDAKTATLEVSHRGKTARGAVACEQKGDFFEEVVGHAFALAGADEVLMQLKWPWSEATRNFFRRMDRDPNRHRVELDVAARFRHQVFAVSCKSGDPDRARQDAERSQIEAVAAGAFGRMTIAALATPFATRQEIDDGEKAPERAARLNLDILADPSTLRDMLSRLEQVKHNTLGPTT